MTTAVKCVPKTNRGKNRPRLLRMAPPGNETLPRNCGSDLSTALYQNSNCSRSGTLRTNST